MSSTKLHKHEILSISTELNKIISSPLIKVNALESVIGTNISQYKDLILLYHAKSDLINEKVDENTRSSSLETAGIHQVSKAYLRSLTEEELSNITIINGIVVHNA